MKYFTCKLCLAFIVLFLSSLVPGCFLASGHELHPQTSDNFFIPNQGQWPASVLFKADLAPGVVFIEKESFLFVVRDEKKIRDILGYKFLSQNEKRLREMPSSLIDYFAFRLYFRNSQALCSVEHSQESFHDFNYFLGSDPGKWAGGLKGYSKLLIKELYPGIDLRLEIARGSLKYSFVISPHANPGLIQMEWESSKRIKIDKSGQLIIPTPLGPLQENAPIAWTTRDGLPSMVPCSFQKRENVVSFHLPEDYKREDTLVIDPILSFASYSGSTVDNWGYTATYDEEGFLYSAGVAFGIGYPIVIGSYQISFAGGTCDIAISKYDTSGSFLIYSTYLGGSATDVPSSLVVNNSNELVLLGCTGSLNFPVTSNAYDQSFNGGSSYTLSSILGFPGGSDIFISRFSPDGTQLLSSTYFGGNGNDGLNAYTPLKMNYADDVRGEIVVDNQDNIYVMSSTSSTNLPVAAGAFQQSFGGGDQDACLFKMNRDLGVLLWASYAGGTGKDAGYSLALGNQGNVFAAGGTTSTDFPGMNGYQPLYGGGNADGFVLKVSNDGQLLRKATYVGYGTYDQVYFVKTDRQNSIYVLGQTSATGNAFIQNVTWSKPSGGQFISKYTPDLNTRLWSTAWGTGNGGPDVSPSAFMIDVCFNIYLSAWGGSSLNGFGGTAGLPVTPDAFQLTTDNKDYYFLVLDKDVTQPIFATYYGGSSSEHVDGGTSRFDRRGAIYQAVCAGCGGIHDFPTTPGAWSNINGSTNCNNAVVKIKFNIPFLVADFIPPASGCAPYTIHFQNMSQIVTGSSPDYQWDFGDGNTSSAHNPIHTYNSSGFYQVKLIITDTLSCNGSDTLVRNLVVLSNSRDTLPDAHLCPGDIAVLGLPPSPDQTITYQWTPTTGLSNPSVSNPIVSIPVSQSYEMMVSNGQCADTFSQYVEVHYVLVDAGNDTAVCHNTLTLKAIGNKPGLIYQWSSNHLFSDTLNLDPLSNSAFVTINNPTTYFVRVSDGYCEAWDSIYVDFLIVAAPLTATPPACHGDCDGTLSASATGGTPPYDFVWSDGQTGSIATGLCAGNYSVTITDSMGCIAISTGIITQPDPISAASLILPTPCEEVCLGSISPGISGGTPLFQYQWSNGQTTQNISGLCTGTYELELIDANGCLFRDTFFVPIKSSFDSILVSPKLDTIFRGQSIPLTVSMIPGATYQWVPVDDLSTPESPLTLASPYESVIYYVKVIDEFGCTWIDSVKIIVKELICDMPYIFVPNAFSPNGDGQNDILYVRSSVTTDIRFVIYDRWGEKVFETTRLDRGWDGMYRGMPCDPGVFVYYLEVICFDGQRYESKGNVTLLR